MEYFEKIRSKEFLESESILLNFLDYSFEGVRLFIEDSTSRLNNSRILFRALRKENALSEFDYFKYACQDFQSSLHEFEKIVKSRSQSRKIDKIFYSMKEIIERSTQRNIKSKIPTPSINYLDTNEVTESDIDWIINQMKTFWGKFLQIYGSLRIEEILSHKNG